MRSAIIIGAGIVGLATGIQLRRRFPNVVIQILEKESDVGKHQSTHNSGVLHCGLYYKPGSLKARLAVSGIREMIDFCVQHGVDHEVCGKLVVATNDDERKRLDELLYRGEANGLQGLKRLTRSQMLQIEPHVGGVEGAFVPEEGIVDYRGVCDAMRHWLERHDAEVVCHSKVTALERVKDDWRVRTAENDFQAQWIVNTTGLHCDRTARLADVPLDMKIVPFRGEYYKLADHARHLCRHLIYPVPDPSFPFLGVHFTRLIHGGVEAGPNAVLAFAREGYRMTQINISDLFDAVSFSGFWRFLRRYPSMAFHEFAQSLSKARFVNSWQKLVPEIRREDLVTGGSGVRAQAMSRSGELIQDFRVELGDHAVHLLNAPSPAATASLAIGAEIAQKMH